MDEVKTAKDEKPVKAKQPALTRLQLAVFAFLFGMVAFVGIRYATIKDTSVHHHANFALYVNGQRDEFKSFTFYEEVQACSNHDADNVKAKVHMHDNNSGLVHVHAGGVTWGQFFANLGYGLSSKALTTDKGVFVDNQDGNELTFLVNGQPVMNIANQIIKSEDKVLINYGKDSDATIKQRVDSLPSDAREANTKDDPATCSGAHKFTPKERLKAVLGLE